MLAAEDERCFLPRMRLPNQTLSKMVLTCLLVTCTNPVANRYSVLWVMVGQGTLEMKGQGTKGEQES